MEKRKTVEKSPWNQELIFEKINKIAHSSIKLRKREKTQITKIRN